MNKSLFIFILFLSGCSSSSRVDPLEFVRAGHYQEAEQHITNNLDKYGKDRLLHALEMGMLSHLQGNYKKSNNYFDKAERLSEKFYTVSVSDEVTELLTGPSYSTYKGFIFENTFVNYYKALNYLKLAEQGENISQHHLDEALVEIRRLGNRLTVLTNETGGYSRSHRRDTEGATAAAFLDIIKQAFGEPANSHLLEYRDDAFAHYFSGILYEMSHDLDGARIEYVKAAQAYENGFAEQYKLDESNINQVWFDAIRVMKLSGGYEHKWQTLAQDKLTIEQQQNIAQLTKDSSELLVLQHTGLAPQRKELNMMLSVDDYSNSLVLTPIPVGNSRERKEQLQWFAMLYADTGLFDMIQNYIVGDIHTVFAGTVTKRIPLGPLWRQAQRSGLIEALEIPTRVSVSYYPSVINQFETTELYIDGKKSSELIQANSIARIALQEQLRVANKEIQWALTRELVKAALANKAKKELNLKKDDPLNLIFSLASVVLRSITASADTRNWLTLPSGVKFTRVPVSVGEHQIKLVTTLTSGKVIEQEQTIKVHNERPTLWHTRTFSRKPILEMLKK